MIRARIAERGEGNRIASVRVEGHAGYSAHGSDIVCAGVSALVINFVNSVEVFCGQGLSGTVEDGLLDVEVPDDPCAQLLAASLAAGLEGISGAHPDHVRVRRVLAAGSDARPKKRGGDTGNAF